jgi:hypothetical protein
LLEAVHPLPAASTWSRPPTLRSGRLGGEAFRGLRA